jgi:ABC-2 type transport system permease protein
MTSITTSTSASPRRPPAPRPSWRAEVGIARGLAVRNLRNIRRMPSAFVPALMMPLVQSVAFSGTFFAITQIPGFPTDRSINWFMPLAVIMGASFAGIGFGFSTVRDLESGFYDRLRMAPLRRRSLLLGALFAVWVRVGIMMVIVISTGFALGARLTHGVLGLLPLILAGLGVAVIGTGWGLGLAFRFKDMRASAIMQLSLFLALFLTTAQAPLSLMTGWLYHVARLNPFTAVIQLARTGFVNNANWGVAAVGVGSLVVIGMIALWFADTGLRRLSR